jgi:hypothetical protein
MADVLMNQSFLGIVDCVLDRLKLLCEYKAWSTLFDHADDLSKMPFRAP